MLSVGQSAEQVTAICRSKSGGNSAVDGAPGTRSLSDAQRMRKVIMELVETERAYVKVRLGQVAGLGEIGAGGCPR